MNLDKAADRVLRRLSPALQSRFAADPAQSLRADFHLAVERVEFVASERQDGGSCDGLSYLDDGVVLYSPTPGSRRENFTLAHELAHFLVQSDNVFDWIADQADPPKVLESVCDRIAQRLLMQPGQVDAVLAGGMPTAQHLLDLFDATSASRPVCAIVLAGRLPGLGAVVIIDRASGEVTHASIATDPDNGWPTIFPWRGQIVDDGHSLRTLGSGEHLRRTIEWRAPWGPQARFYADAVADDKRSYVVLSGTDLWTPRAARIELERDYDKRPLLTVHCCGQTSRVRDWPCPVCKQARCPVCGKCQCERQQASAQACNECFRSFAPHLLVAGLCEECR